MTIKKTLESFDGKFPQELIRKSINWGMEDDPRDDIKDFIKESIIQALDEIKPDKLDIFEPSIEDSTSRVLARQNGWNDCLDQLEDNYKKFMSQYE